MSEPADGLTLLLGQHQQPQDLRRESTMHAAPPETTRGVNSTLQSDISYLIFPRDSQEGQSQEAGIQKQVLVQSAPPD